MVYEWDARRARRAHLTKVAFSLFVVLVVVAVPTWVAVSMTG
ncbi:hypothetical protein [Rhizobium terrae]|nr:hypothetical protein [Rhizobium terrae]